MTTLYQEVDHVLTNYAAAVYEQDVEQFLSAYHADVHIYDCWGNWEIKGLAGWRDSVTSWFTQLRDDQNVVKVHFHSVTTEQNDHLAYVHCAVTFTGYEKESEKALRHMTNRFTFGLTKNDGSWLITHEHSSLPIEPETGKGMFDSKP